MNRKSRGLKEGWYQKGEQMRFFIKYDHGMIIYQTKSQYEKWQFYKTFNSRKLEVSRSHPYFDKWWIGSEQMSPHSLYPVQLELFKEER